MLAALLAAGPARAASLTSLRHETEPLYTRLTADFDGVIRAPSHTNEIFEYSRFYVDIPGVLAGLADQSLAVADGLIDRVETVYYARQKVQRFIVYLRQKAPYEVKIADKLGNKLVMDVLRNGKVAPTPAGAVAGRATMAPSAAGAARLAGLRKKIVIIDPGHGGQSEGAVSASLKGLGRVREKDVVLKVAFELEKLIAQSSNMECHLTRRADTYVSLSDRRAFSKARNGDVFLSLHCNSAPGRSGASAHGVEFFYLSDKGESDVAGSLLESAENDEGIGDVKKNGNGELGKILKGLTQSVMAEYATDSRKLCDLMNRRFRQYSYSGFTTYNRGVKRANFEVLRQASPDASLLLEIGFLSNPTEARQLADADFQKKVAQLVFAALNDYFSECDPDFKPARVALK